MTIFGVDIHPEYQAGISIEQIRAEGFDFMACKVSQGTTVYASQDWLRRGRACGLLCLGYHYLNAGNESAQARVFADQLAQAGVPGMLDVENGSGGVNNVRMFLDAAMAYGAQVPLVYLPHWYWQQIGSPSLTGLPPLWASSYVSAGGFASALYGAVASSCWNGYGGLGVEVLQFTDKANVAGRQIDANAYRGGRGEFTALLGAPVQPTPVQPPVPANQGWASIPDMMVGQNSPAIARVQVWLNTNFPAYSNISPTEGDYGPQTTKVIAEFQRRVGIIGGDGRNVGPQTKQAMWQLGFRG